MGDKFIIKKADEMFGVYELNSEHILIGRANECQLVLPDEGVSRYHAHLQRNRETWLLRDEKSFNGLFLNGKKIKQEYLTPGDVITIGPFHLDFVTPSTLNSNLSVTVTNVSLLMGLKNLQDIQAWNRFNARYCPMIKSFVRKMGFDDSTSDDIVQETILAFVDMYTNGKYDKTKGRLKSWLYGIAYRKVVDHRRKHRREFVLDEKSDASGIMNRIPSEDKLSQVWNAEWEDHVLRACLNELTQRVETKTLKAFELYVLKEWRIEDVAAHLDMSRNSVYIAKTRVMKHIQEIKKDMDRFW
jgi:RNA polymerase sigma-70 factor (ECF subfamily)